MAGYPKPAPLDPTTAIPPLLKPALWPIRDYVDISAVALRGVYQAQTNFDQAARNLASAWSASSNSSPTDTVDLSDAAAALLSARSQAEAGLRTVEVTGDMHRQDIDLLAGRSS